MGILKCVYGDSERFIQIVQNFLSNAIKFTENGGAVGINVNLLEEQSIIDSEMRSMI